MYHGSEAAVSDKGGTLLSQWYEVNTYEVLTRSRQEGGAKTIMGLCLKCCVEEEENFANLMRSTRTLHGILEEKKLQEFFEDYD